MKEKEKSSLKTETIENREINLKQILVKEVSDNLLSKVNNNNLFHWEGTATFPEQFD